MTSRTRAEGDGRRRYLESVARELTAQADRVRDLIGSRHWLSDGVHKEELLRAVLRRHSPAGIAWERGFVICPSDAQSCSQEQDILALDLTQEAPVFQQGDLAIAFPRAVLAAIGVKTTLRRDNLTTAVRGLNSVRRVAQDAGLDAGRIWCGAFFYNPETSPLAPDSAYDWILKAVCADPVERGALPGPLGPDVVSLAENEFFRLTYGVASEEPRIAVRGFDCGGLASGMFLASVLDHIAAVRGHAATDISAFAEGCAAIELSPARRESSLLRS